MISTTLYSGFKISIAIMVGDVRTLNVETFMKKTPTFTSILTQHQQGGLTFPNTY